MNKSLRCGLQASLVVLGITILPPSITNADARPLQLSATKGDPDEPEGPTPLKAANRPLVQSSSRTSLPVTRIGRIRNYGRILLDLSRGVD